MEAQTWPGRVEVFQINSFRNGLLLLGAPDSVQLSLDRSDVNAGHPRLRGESGRGQFLNPLYVEIGHELRMNPLNVEIGHELRTNPLYVEIGHELRTNPLNADWP